MSQEGRVLDYTTRISSRRDPIDGTPLRPCPKCNKLGKHSHGRTRIDGQVVTRHRVVHRCRIIRNPMPSVLIDEACEWTAPVSPDPDEL